FDAVLEEAVDEHAARNRRLADLLLREADAHRPAAEHVRRADQHGIADLIGDGDGLVARRGDAPAGRADVVRAQETGEPLAILCEVDRLVRRAEDAVAGLFDRVRQLERRLPAELDDDALGLLALADREHRLRVERLEVQAVRRVVVRRDRLRVAVHHHGLVAELTEGRDGVHAAVVELDALPDPVRPRAEDDDAGLRAGGPGLLRLAPGRIEVVRGRLDLARARVDAAIDVAHAARAPPRPDDALGHPERCRELAVAEADALQAEPVVGGQGFRVGAADALRRRRDPLELAPEERMDACRRLAERRPRRRGAEVALARPHRLQERLRERAADAH